MGLLVKLLLVAAILGMLWAGVAKIEQRGWDKRDLIAKKAELKAAEDSRKAEKDHAQLLADIGNHYKKEFEDAEARRKADVNAARSGALRLRVPGTLCPSLPEVAGSAPRSDGQAGAELPRQVTEDLLNLVNDADAVVRQLTACQAVITSDRR